MPRDDPSFSIARAISNSAPRPWTRTGNNTGCTHGARRCNTLRMSCSAAPEADVTMPITRQNPGIGRLRAASNKPSACSFRFNASKRACKSPVPARSAFCTMICNCPRASYTLASANTRTFAPSTNASAPGSLARPEHRTLDLRPRILQRKIPVPAALLLQIRHLAFHPYLPHLHL